MKKLIWDTILLAIVIFLFYILYSHQGLLTINWLNYELHTSLFLTVTAIFILIIFYKIIKSIRKTFYFLFLKDNLNQIIFSYIKHLKITNEFDREIQLILINKEIKDLKALKFLVNLNELLDRGNYHKIIHIVNNKKTNNKLKDICNYTHINVLLATNKIKEATELCKLYINDSQKPTWAFIKLLEICLSYNLTNEFETLNNYLYNKKLDLNKNLSSKIYCLIVYKLALVNSYVNPKNSNKELQSLIKKYPRFIPAYTLIIRNLIQLGNDNNIKEIMVKSWANKISLENTILWSNFFKIEDKDFLLKEVKNLLNNAQNPEKKDAIYLLLITISSTLNNPLEIPEYFANVKNNDSDFYNLVNLYVNLKERSFKNSYNFIETLSKNNNSNWWNEYIK